MDNKLTSLIEEDRFDPRSHPSLREFNDILARVKGDERGEEGEGSGDEVQVGKVNNPSGCELLGVRVCVCTCVRCKCHSNVQ